MVNNVSFDAIEKYLRENSYPSEITGDKGKKANFRKACKPFWVKKGKSLKTTWKLSPNIKNVSIRSIENYKIAIWNHFTLQTSKRKTYDFPKLGSTYFQDGVHIS